MNKLRCIVVDDDQHTADLLAEYVEKTPFLELAFSTTQPVQVVEWLAHNPAQLCFSDIEMPQLTGINLIKAVNGRCRFVLCTAFPNYALQGFEHDVIDYLMKPVDYTRFLKAAQKALAQINGSGVPPPVADTGFFIKTGLRSQFVRVEFDDIIMIEAAGNFAQVHTPAGKLLAGNTLREILLQLPPQYFLRVHNSYVVPLKQILKVEGNTIILKHLNKTLTVGGTYKDALLAALRITG
jgi:two-component system, LytTR family, response regulator